MYIYSEFHLIIYLRPVGPKLPVAIHTRLLDCSVIKIIILHVAAYIVWCTVQLDHAYGDWGHRCWPAFTKEQSSHHSHCTTRKDSFHVL